MEPITIRGVTLGEGATKIIVSVMDAAVDGIVSTAQIAQQAPIDVIEWRADWSADVHDPAKMAENAPKIRAAFDRPILFTLRSTFEGGQMTLPVKEYVELNKAVISTGCIDLVDVEVLIGDDAARELIEYAHEFDVKVIASYHNFVGTPSQDWMVDKLCHMQDLGADIPKIAVMANSPQDAYRLMAATDEMNRLHAYGPLLTMAMGRDGSISRITGELCGSALTFCSLEKASAPGQIPVQEARVLMDMFHEVLS